MGGDSAGLSDIKSSEPSGHLRVAAIITPLRSGRRRNTEDVICNIRSKLPCASLWLESGELDLSNLWERDQVSHTLSPLIPLLGIRSDARQTGMHLQRQRLIMVHGNNTKFFCSLSLHCKLSHITLRISDQTISDPQIPSAFSNSYLLMMWKRPVTAQGKLLKTCGHVREIN